VNSWSSVHLDDSTWDFDPTISYDGSKVVFARFDPTTWSSDIYSVDPDGSDLQLVVPGGGTNDLAMPPVSPDGSAIAYWCGPARYATSQGPGCGPLTDGSFRQWGVMRANIDRTLGRS
jgi:Tol biopolymer transport system component